MTTVLLALVAGALFGVNVHIQQMGLDALDARLGAFISVGSMAALLFLLSPFFVDWQWLRSDAVLLFALCGIVFPALGQRLQVSSVELVGPALTSAIGSFAPLFAVVPAVMFLGEAFGPQAAIGMALMTTGLVLSALQTKTIARNWPLWALLLPLGAAMARGIVQPVTKTGLSVLPSAFFATLVMATVSTAVLGIMVLASRRRYEKTNSRRGYLLFALSGAINGSGILIMIFAISKGDVTVAAPLASTTPIWALAFGATVFRREHLGIRHLAVTLLVVIGSVIIIAR